MIRTVVGLCVIYLFVGQLYAQYCRVNLSMLNSYRYVDGEVYKECGFWHSPPFGNWGVDSNVGSRQDGDQFQGWKPSGGHHQWNSCTKGEWEAPDYRYYNWNSYTTQKGRGGANKYGGVMYRMSVSYEDYDAIDEEWIGGCRDLDGLTFTISGNKMNLYELDRADRDDYVTTLGFSNVQVTLDCPDSGYCNSVSSPWVQSGSNSIARAKIRLSVGTVRYVHNWSTCPEV